MTAGAGVSLAVRPVPPFASGMITPDAGFLNCPEEVEVMTYPVAPLVETVSWCAASET